MAAGGAGGDRRERAQRRVAGDCEGARGHDRRGEHHRGLGQLDPSGAYAEQAHAERWGEGEAGGDAGDQPGGREQRLDDPGGGGEVEAGERVLHRAEEADAGEQHHDVGGDDQRGADVDAEAQRGRIGHQGDHRGHEPTGGLLVEHRPPLPVEVAHQHRDHHAGEGGDRDHEQVAVEQGGHRAADDPGDDHRCPRGQVVVGGVEPGDPAACLRDVGAARQHVVDQPLHPGEVVVVEVALPDRAGEHERRLVGVDLVGHPQRREGDVDVGLAQSGVLGERQHRGGHVGRARARGEQDLPDPERQVEDPVGLPHLTHDAMVGPMPEPTQTDGPVVRSTPSCGRWRRPRDGWRHRAWWPPRTGSCAPCRARG